MVLIYTNLGVTSLSVVILVNVLLFMGIFSRMIPSQAMISAIPSQDSRGAFMAVSSSLQQIAGGFASILAGLMVSENSEGKIEHFDRVGYVMMVTVFISVLLMYKIHVRIKKSI